MKGLKNNVTIRALALSTAVTLLALGVCKPAVAKEEVVGPMVEVDENHEQASILEYSEPITPKDDCPGGHDMVLQGVLRDSTCISAGVSLYVCTKCEYSEERPEPIADSTKHTSDAGTVVKCATETEPGEIEYRCIYCNGVIREEIIPVKAKRETPNAIFNPETSVLSNIPDDSTVMLNGSIVSSKASGELSFEGMFDAAGEYKILVAANDLAPSERSRIQEIAVFKPVAPSQIMTVNETKDGGMGQILCADANMEYRLVDSSEWIPCVISNMPVKAGKYQIRYKATGTSTASDYVTVTVKKDQSLKDEIKETTGIENVVTNSIEFLIDVAKAPEKKKNTVKEEKANKEDKKLDSRSDEAGKDKEVKEEAKKDAVDSKSSEEVVVVDDTIIVEVDDKYKPPVVQKQSNSMIYLSSDSGWENVLASMKDCEGTVVLTLGEKTAVPAAVFVEAAKSGITLQIVANENAKWIIKPEDINVEEVELLGSINLGIRYDSTVVPGDAMNTVINRTKFQIKDSEFEIMHEGNFGFKSQFVVTVPKGTPSEFAGLFCYNQITKQMEFVGSSMLNVSREAKFEMTHASGYAIVVSRKELTQESIEKMEEILKEEIDVKEPETYDSVLVDENGNAIKFETKQSPYRTIVIIIVILVAAFLSFVIISKIRKELGSGDDDKDSTSSK